MPTPTFIPMAPQELLERALAGHRDVLGCGIAQGDDAGASIGRDERNAPFALADDGSEDRSLLVSITDEGAERLCAAVRVGAGSDVLGIGIDLASPADWEGESGAHFAGLLFTVGEKELISAGSGPDPMLHAKAFSAKEAAFKATSAPLRRWHEAHGGELFFEARDFELASWDESRGTARTGRAALACAKMGISRIEVSFCTYAGMAFCVAVAVAVAV